jgi:hypothetical protein
MDLLSENCEIVTHGVASKTRSGPTTSVSLLAKLLEPTFLSTWLELSSGTDGAVESTDDPLDVLKSKPVGWSRIVHNLTTHSGSIHPKEFSFQAKMHKPSASSLAILLEGVSETLHKEREAQSARRAGEVAIAEVH